MRTIDGEDFNDIGVAHFCGETGLVFEGLDANFVVTVFLVENFNCDFAISVVSQPTKMTLMPPVAKRFSRR